MLFEDIPAHNSIKDRLRGFADSGKIPHALLFEGPSGVGKFSIARAFAQYIHCTGKVEGAKDSCGECPSCRQHQNLGHIDTHYVFPVLKTDAFKNPTSDDYLPEWGEYIRDRRYMDFGAWTKAIEGDKKNPQPIIYVYESAALLHKLSFASHGSKYKIVIWWLPEKMNTEAANKLLKLLEEPWEDTLFLMVSDNSAEILPTISSRLQKISFSKLSDANVSEIIENIAGVSPDSSLSVAHCANGSVSAALRNLGNLGDESEYLERFISLMRLAYQRKIADLKKWSEDLTAIGREREIRFYDYCCRLIRENFIFNFKLPQLNFLSASESQFSVNFARFINERNVEKLIDVFDKAIIDISGNGNGKIINFDVAIKVILLLKQ
ncbi:MAG: DNA polymerase III subunit delta [Barnesiella sp.]|nr:DNA polymerase III subunit delta [Barnesiella sp.]